MDLVSSSSAPTIYNPSKQKRQENHNHTHHRSPLPRLHYSKSSCNKGAEELAFLNQNLDREASDADLKASDTDMKDSDSHLKAPPRKSSALKAACNKDCGLTTSHWLAGLLFFLILDCILLTQLIRVGMGLIHLTISPGTEPSSNESSPVLLEDSPFCLPCSHVYLTQVEVLQNRFKVTQRRDEENRALCCAQPHDNLAIFLGILFIRVHYPRDRANGEISVVDDTVNNATADGDEQQLPGIRPHLQLNLDTEKPPPEVNGTHTLPLRLTKRSAPAADDTQTSAIVDEGSVKIVYNGMFYIHSQIPFKFSPPSPILTQYVFRVRNEGEKLLLKNSVFPCDVSVESCEHSFAAGLFLLEAGDKIVLRVSNHSFVEKDKGLLFGIHRV